jgi:hypothetical protein
LRGRKASEPWRGASNFRCDMMSGGWWEDERRVESWRFQAVVVVVWELSLKVAWARAERARVNCGGLSSQAPNGCTRPGQSGSIARNSPPQPSNRSDVRALSNCPLELPAISVSPLPTPTPRLLSPSLAHSPIFRSVHLPATPATPPAPKRTPPAQGSFAAIRGPPDIPPLVVPNLTLHLSLP